ncbi:MAG: NAD(P)-dependent oxidoreductase [Sphingomonadales bacterium]|nr:NAD(P)-dependent oxidoreductase [Sphingomonadales bacterium]
MAHDVTLIGFGEAGSTFARAGGWAARAMGWDVLAPRRAVMAELGVDAASDAATALRDAPLVLSLVTADAALPAAQDYAAMLRAGALWCDGNSVAPETKCAAARTIEAAGGRYVDVAVLAPVNPAGLAVPLLLAGKAAPEADAALRALGFTNLRVVGDAVGKASAIKMIRSVMVKGIEALTDEMMAAAHAAGVEEEVLASLDASEKAIPWATRAAYNLERMETHGLRRAAEMEESAKTLASLGVDPVMTRGTVLRQRAAARTSQTPFVSSAVDTPARRVSTALDTNGTGVE